jgi:hypothetical protein
MSLGKTNIKLHTSEIAMWSKDYCVEVVVMPEGLNRSTTIYTQHRATGYIAWTAGKNIRKPSGNYIYHRVLQSVTLHVVFVGLVRFSV